MKTESKAALMFGGNIFYFFRRKIPHSRKPNGLVDPVKIGPDIVLLVNLTGCVGSVDGGYAASEK